MEYFNSKIAPSIFKCNNVYYQGALMKYVYYFQPYIMEYLHRQLWIFYPFCICFGNVLCVCAVCMYMCMGRSICVQAETIGKHLFPFLSHSMLFLWDRDSHYTLPLKYHLGWLASNPHQSSCLVHHSDRWPVSEGTSCFYIGPGNVSSGFYDSPTSVLTCSDISPGCN